MKDNWTLTDMPDQTGKVVVITGTTSGIGYEQAKAFAARNATLVVGVRNVEKGEQQAGEFRHANENAEIEVSYLDLGDLSSVRDFADKFSQTYDRLDVLINNAGLMAVPYGKTKDGFETHIGVNYVAHFVLTALLLDKIKSTSGSRVVNVSSNAEMLGNIKWLLKDFNQEKFYERWISYGHSKQANVMFSYELERRLREHEIDAVSIAAHPGFPQTHLRTRHFEDPSLFHRTMHRMFELLGTGHTPMMGALPILYAATDPETEGGAFYGVEGLIQRAGSPRKRKTTRRSYNRETAKRLWETTEELTGVSFDFN
jgi:NAD(P)-dependent dehydrogenase (short-subunit alcohol dehydrogenase family)